MMMLPKPMSDFPGPMTLSAIRSRCHVLIAFQQYLDKLHISFAHLIPHALQLELVDILLHSVNQAAKANRDDEFLNTLSTYMLPDARLHIANPLNGGSFAESALASTASGNGDDFHPSKIELTTAEPSAVVLPAVDGEGIEEEHELASTGSPKGTDHAIGKGSAPHTVGNADQDGHPVEYEEFGEDADEQEPDPLFPENLKTADVDDPNGDSHEVDVAVTAEQVPQSGPSTSISGPTSEMKETEVDGLKGEPNGVEEQNLVHWPQLMMDVSEKRKSVFHGLVRVEAEGGALAIGALLRCLHAQEKVGEMIDVWRNAPKYCPRYYGVHGNESMAFCLDHYYFNFVPRSPALCSDNETKNVVGCLHFNK